MNSTCVFSVFAFFVLVFFLFHSLFNSFSRNRGKLPHPPGSMGCPYIGETFQLYSQNANVSFASTQKSYGSVFKTYILGCPSRPTYPPGAYPPPPRGYPPPPQGHPSHGYPPAGYGPGTYPPAGYPHASQSGHGGVEAMIARVAAAAAAAYGAHLFAHGVPQSGHGGLHPMESSSSMVESSSTVEGSSTENLSAESMEHLAGNSSSGSDILSDS